WASARRSKQSDRNRPRRQSPETYAPPILPLFVIPAAFVIPASFVIPAKAGIQPPNAAGIYQKKQKPPPPSFPRRRESRPQTRQESIGNG
ncbi:TPA: hypothetical protein ACJJKU_000319, partial [Neisseria meningitidis]